MICRILFPFPFFLVLPFQKFSECFAFVFLLPFYFLLFPFNFYLPGKSPDVKRVKYIADYSDGYTCLVKGIEIDRTDPIFPLS
jgi:hypothetical protein